MVSTGATGAAGAQRSGGAQRSAGDQRSTDPRAWTEPGAYPVDAAVPGLPGLHGVHRIPLPLPMDGLRAVNVYAIETDEGLTLVDGGWAIEEARALLESALKELGYAVGDIRRFLVTHVHRDHYTQAVTVRREVGSHVSLGIGDKPTLDLMHHTTLDPNPHVGQLARAGAGDLAEQWRTFGANERPDLSLWEYPDAWLEGDHTIGVGGRELEAVHTPGHTQGHFVFADRAAGVLFAGDHVLPRITPSIGFEPVRADQPLGDFLGSLAKVRAMPDLVLLPAHGPVAPSVHARIDELVAHHDERLALCLAAVHGGARTAYEVAGELPWTRHGRALGELNVFDGALATLETSAHLDLLAAQGRLTRGDDGDEEPVRYE